MAISPMYEGMNNSPQTDISAAITSSDSVIPVTDIAVFPAAPNLATLGTDEDAEVIRYGGIDGSTLTDCARGFGQTAAKAWEAGTVISRQITKYDLDILRTNILDLDTRKANTADLGDLASLDTVNLASKVEGKLPIANGGTNATTAAAAWTNLGGGTIGKKNSLVANDIPELDTSKLATGTLGVARGGTGKDTHTANAVLTGNGTSAVKNVATASGALYATAANGAPVFGKLPIAQGGTNATNAATAWANLGGGDIGKLDTVNLASNVEGKLPIANGGTNANSRTGAVKSLFNESMLNSASHVLAISSDWSKAGYISLQGLRKVSGLGDTTGALPVANGGTGGNDTGWLTLATQNCSAGNIYYRRIGFLCQVVGTGIKLSNACSSGQNVAVGVLPNNYRPNMYNSFSFGCCGTSNPMFVNFQANDGQTASTRRLIKTQSPQLTHVISQRVFSCQLTYHKKGVKNGIQ